MALSDWAFTGFESKEGRWPMMENGEPVRPVFLTHVNGSQLDFNIVISLLKAFDIPVLVRYPNDGKFGELIIGTAGPGIDVYVPEDKFEDAENIISGEGVEESQEDQNEL